jgi:hypothetical protein
MCRATVGRRCGWSSSRLAGACRIVSFVAETIRDGGGSVVSGVVLGWCWVVRRFGTVLGVWCRVLGGCWVVRRFVTTRFGTAQRIARRSPGHRHSAGPLLRLYCASARTETIRQDREWQAGNREATDHRSNVSIDLAVLPSPCSHSAAPIAVLTQRCRLGGRRRRPLRRWRRHRRGTRRTGDGGDRRIGTGAAHRSGC